MARKLFAGFGVPAAAVPCAILVIPCRYVPIMPYAKYTLDVLSTAVSQSRSIADVMRHLGIRWNGGAHAHISRQLRRFGIDTSHFVGSVHNRGGTSVNRKTAELILVKSSIDARRTPGFRLKRAMREVGIPERCARCGLGTTWNGEQLILHVDHVNGDFLDNRRENVRFLCPNCHSQTATFAGRSRRVLGRTLPAAPLAGTETPSRSETASSREDVVGVLVRFNDGELTAAQAAEELGCHRNHVFLMRKRLIEAGEMDPRIRERLRAAQRDAVIAFALESPDKGYRAISAALRERPNGRMIVGHDRIRAILLDVGLNTPGARRSAAVHARPDKRLDSSAQAEVAEWQTRRP